MLNFRRGIKAHSINDMHPPPRQEIIQRLMHSDLESVCFGLSVVHLSFANKNRLSFNAPFRFAEKRLLSADSEIYDFQLSESRLMRLLGCTITEIKCEADGTLHLTFSNDDLLIVYANDPAYEAYTLSIDGNEYVV